MKYIASVLMPLFITFSVVFPQGENTESSALNEIRAALADSEAGWNNGDIDRYMACYHRSDKMRFAGNGEFNHGWENTLERYRNAYPDKAAMGELTFSDVDITLLCNDAALVFGRWTLKYPDRERTGLYTLLMKKFSEGWKIVHDHSSSAL